MPVGTIKTRILHAKRLLMHCLAAFSMAAAAYCAWALSTMAAACSRARPASRAASLAKLSRQRPMALGPSLTRASISCRSARIAASVASGAKATATV